MMHRMPSTHQIVKMVVKPVEFGFKSMAMSDVTTHPESTGLDRKSKFRRFEAYTPYIFFLRC